MKRKSKFSRDLNRVLRYAKCGNINALYRMFYDPKLCAVFASEFGSEAKETRFWRICQERDLNIQDLALNRVMNAAAANDVAFIKSLIENHLNLSLTNEDGETILGFACCWDAVEVVKLLCESGADVNQLENGRSVLVGVECAAGTNKRQSKIKNILVKHGALPVVDQFEFNKYIARIS